jgi:lipoprotein-releasing system permease protein
MAKGNTAFYIARRCIAKKGSQAVSFITGLAAFAMMIWYLCLLLFRFFLD